MHWHSSFEEAVNENSLQMDHTKRYQKKLIELYNQVYVKVVEALKMASSQSNQKCFKKNKTKWTKIAYGAELHKIVSTKGVKYCHRHMLLQFLSFTVTGYDIKKKYSVPLKKIDPLL